MADFLLELWVEDLPVSVQKAAELKLKEAVENLFTGEKIDYGESKVFSTPRRVAVLFKDVSRVTREEKVSVKGPPARICFEGEDKPTVVLDGFLKKHSADLSDVRVRDEGKGEFVFLEKIISSRSFEEAVRNKIPEALEEIKFSKVMRWGQYSFPRPVRNVLVMFGKKFLKVRCFGINSSRSSRGFMGEAIKITSPADYETNLKRKRILAGASARLGFFREKELKAALSPA
ncbi:MAG: glycine--tRNA ligase subunit beta, partial [Elusimicrobiota bacterium]|nr:glycine--tRNA ligase subunit beta [Elusimicrobiota bacterium]